MKLSNQLVILIFNFLFLYNCQRPENLALLVAPISYSIAKNALEQNKKDGEYLIRLKFNNIEKMESDWPSGEIKFDVESVESPG